jgi:hypothetical protein
MMVEEMVVSWTTLAITSVDVKPWAEARGEKKTAEAESRIEIESILVGGGLCWTAHKQFRHAHFIDSVSDQREERLWASRSQYLLGLKIRDSVPSV